MVKNSNLNISQTKVNLCYVESLMSRYDTQKDPKVSCQMRYVEFIVFICKMAFEIYRGTKQKTLPLQNKIDSILNPLLGTIMKEKKFSLDQEKPDFVLKKATDAETVSEKVEEIRKETSEGRETP